MISISLDNPNQPRRKLPMAAECAQAGMLEPVLPALPCLANLHRSRTLLSFDPNLVITIFPPYALLSHAEPQVYDVSAQLKRVLDLSYRHTFTDEE